jgi:hypothetical protein
MGTLGVVILFAAIALLDIRSLWKDHNKKVILLYASLLGLAFILSELHILGFKLIGLNQLVGAFAKLMGL